MLISIFTLFCKEFIGNTNFNNQLIAFEGEGGVTHEIPEQPPTPTLPSQDGEHLLHELVIKGV